MNKVDLMSIIVYLIPKKSFKFLKYVLKKIKNYL